MIRFIYDKRKIRARHTIVGKIFSLCKKSFIFRENFSVIDVKKDEILDHMMNKF